MLFTTVFRKAAATLTVSGGSGAGGGIFNEENEAVIEAMLEESDDAITGKVVGVACTDATSVAPSPEEEEEGEEANEREDLTNFFILLSVLAFFSLLRLDVSLSISATATVAIAASSEPGRVPTNSRVPGRALLIPSPSPAPPVPSSRAGEASILREGGVASVSSTVGATLRNRLMMDS